MGNHGKKLISGRVEVEVNGLNIERFFNICSKRSLLIENVDQSRFFTSPGDFKKMKDVARKTGVHLKIKGKHGLPFFLYQNRKRKLLGIGMGIFILILYLSSFFIWDISFEGNRRFTDSMLNTYLEAVSVRHGMKKIDLSCDALEAGIRNAFPEITWVTVEIRGTRLIIRVKENDVIMEPTCEEEAACDLVAERNGTIKEMIVRKGFPLVKVGDAVEKGTLLIDGTIPVYDDSESLINSHEVHADAEILAETVHLFEWKVPLSKKEKVRTGLLKKGGFIRVFENAFYFMLPLNDECFWEIIKEERQIHFLDNFYLPIYFGRLAAFKYEEYERFYTEEEAEKIGAQSMQEYIEKLLEKGIQILGSDGRIEFNESEWTYVGTIRVIENIAIEYRSVGIDEEN